MARGGAPAGADGVECAAGAVTVLPRAGERRSLASNNWASSRDIAVCKRLGAFHPSTVARARAGVQINIIGPLDEAQTRAIPGGDPSGAPRRGGDPSGAPRRGGDPSGAPRRGEGRGAGRGRTASCDGAEDRVTAARDGGRAGARREEGTMQRAGGRLF